MNKTPCVIWFTGLSGAGKSTLANAVNRVLRDRGVRAYVLDGDRLRDGLNRDLGYGHADRAENIRRVGEVAKLMLDAGLVVLVALISPFRAERRGVRELFAPGDFIEVHVSTPLAVCERRDPKGLYRKARAGEMRDFTGISSPYEEPEAPELVLDTARLSLDDCVMRILKATSWLRARDRARRA
jgi:adenylyl-sulfate kinase